MKSNDGNDDDGNKAEAPPSSSEHEFETSLSRLIELSGKPRLNEERERSERDDLLKYFRRHGYTSGEISRFTGGNLKEDTIKKIVRGIQIDDDDDASLKKRAAELIGSMVRADLAFEDIRTGISVKNGLPEGVTVRDLSSFIADVHQSPDIVGGVKSVLSMYGEMISGVIGLSKNEQLP